MYIFICILIYLKMNKEDLKIEFRAVPYTKLSHVLEYRISPNQNLQYKKLHIWLFGLIKFYTKSKYSTKWIQPNVFHNYCTSCYYDENDYWNYGPIFIDHIKTLDKYKCYETYGDFMKWKIEFENNEKIDYRKDREAYLKECGIWY